MNAEQIFAIDTEIRKTFDGVVAKEARLIELLQQMDKLMGYKLLGYASLWEYSVKGLKMTESQASAYVTVSRKGLEVKELDAAVKSGQLSVSKAKRITSVITPFNAATWIGKAQTMTQHQLEREKLPILPQGHLESEMRSTERVIQLSLSVTREFLDSLADAQELLSQPTRELTLEKVLRSFLDKKDPLRKAERCAPKKTGSKEGKRPLDRSFSFFQTEDETRKEPIVGFTSVLHNNRESALRTQHSSRNVRKNLPAAIRHSVALRDQGKCQFQLPNGKACGSRVGIHLHHRIPVSAGGTNVLNNLVTYCASHHGLHHFREEMRVGR